MFEIENGLVGMNRNIFLKLMMKCGIGNKKIRVIVGICVQTYCWKIHDVFRDILCKRKCSLKFTDTGIVINDNCVEVPWLGRIPFNEADADDEDSYENDDWYADEYPYGRWMARYTYPFYTVVIGEEVDERIFRMVCVMNKVVVPEKLYNRGDFGVGVFSSSNPKDRLMFHQSGCITHGRSIKCLDGCDTYKEGSIVCVEVDVYRHTVEFIVDDVRQPYTVTNVPIPLNYTVSLLPGESFSVISVRSYSSSIIVTNSRDLVVKYLSNGERKEEDWFGYNMKTGKVSKKMLKKKKKGKKKR